MNRRELNGLIGGVIATVPTPFTDDFKVDYGRMAEATARWVDEGLVKGTAVIKVAAVMGEGPQLREEEWPKLLKTVVDAGHDRIAVVCGIHYKDTLRTIEDAKVAQDLGAIGVQIAPPIFNDPTQDDILDYYEAVSNAIGIGIIVYNSHWLYHGAIEAATFDRLVDFERVVAVKWNPPPGTPYEEIYRHADKVNVIDNSSQPVLGHQLGGRGFINLTAEVYPRHDLHIWQLIEAGEYAEAQAEWDKVAAPLSTFYAKVVARSGGQGRVKKGLMQVMGRSFGASRPPSKPLAQDELDELRQMLEGFGWPVPTRA